MSATRFENLVGGSWQPGTGAELPVVSPRTGQRLGVLRSSTADDVGRVIQAACKAWPAWRAAPLRDRVGLLFKFRELLLGELDQVAELASEESGKTVGEARAGIQRGIEVVEFACSLQNLDQGGALEVSRGVSCEYRREPLGVVAGITPFNFPAMVPMWMFPIALSVGNAFVLKPSEKVPSAAGLLGDLLVRAGYPAGVFSVLHGDRTTVEALLARPELCAVAFVGSTPAAHAVYAGATAAGKRALCLGGAKNHLIAMPDAEPNLTVKAVVDSFTGCAGQRCMAASVLIAVGDASRLVEPIARAAAAIELGSGMGALIDGHARARLVAAIDRAESEGAVVLLDGRNAMPPAGCENGNWLGATVLDHVRSEMACAHDELFGPVLSVIHVDTLEQALALERNNPYGNATSVFTTSGAVARYVGERATSGMVGVNVGVPVPREPFSFGGTKQSKFGHGDITGPPAIEFWTNLKKITTKWAAQPDSTWMS